MAAASSGGHTPVWLWVVIGVVAVIAVVGMLTKLRR